MCHLCSSTEEPDAVCSFLILFILFIVALEFNQLEKLNLAEALFMIYALGFTLEKVAAMQEHGIKGFFCLFLTYGSY